MKKIFTPVLFFVCGLGFQKAFAGDLTVNLHAIVKPTLEGDPGISIRSDRASGKLQLSVVSDRKEKAVIIILDEEGKKVWQQTSRLTNSGNLIPLKNATNLQEGSYIVQLKSNNKTYTTRFMIWK